ncbi:MAG: Rieske 2Fe-2S domain-containing protein, partial [Pseudomonadota bacterium]
MNGLTAEHYTDPAWLERERRTVFAHGWIALCRDDEVATPGAYLATRLHGEPVVVVRGQDGVVRVLSNVCRHRGMLLTEGKGTHSRLR